MKKQDSFDKFIAKQQKWLNRKMGREKKEREGFLYSPIPKRRDKLGYKL